MLEIITSYTFFRISKGEALEGWHDVHVHAEASGTIIRSGFESVESLPFVDDDELRAALSTLPIVAAVPEIIARAKNEPKGTTTGGLKHLLVSSYRCSC